MGQLRWCRLGPILTCACILLTMVPAACSPPDQTARIRDLVRDAAALAEGHDVAALLALTTEEFRADPGHRDREGVRETLALAFYHYRRFRLLHPSPTIDLAADGTGAVVTVWFLVVRSKVQLPGLEELRADPQGWLARVGDRADLYHLEAQLVLREDGWRAASATLHRPGAGMMGERDGSR